MLAEEFQDLQLNSRKKNILEEIQPQDQDNLEGINGTVEWRASEEFMEQLRETEELGNRINELVGIELYSPFNPIEEI